MDNTKPEVPNGPLGIYLRRAVCSAALQGALLLTRFARWIMYVPMGSAAPLPSTPARRVRLNIPFFVESEAEIKITNSIGR